MFVCWSWINATLFFTYILTGYKSVSLDDIKKFRQLDSICAGHPEYHPNSGIETTTGPLRTRNIKCGWFCNCRRNFKKENWKKNYNHKTYVLAGDGCLMEGISHEALES